MRRKALTMVFAFIALARSYPAGACLNDTAVERGEQEFKSQYDQPATPDPVQAGMNPWAVACVAVGGGLAVGSLVVAIGRQRKQKSEPGRVAPVLPDTDPTTPGRHGPAL